MVRHDIIVMEGTDDIVLRGEKTPQTPGMDNLAKPKRPGLGSRRSSAMSIAQLDLVLDDDGLDGETYGVSELREGLFDAIFTGPNASRSEPLAPAHILHSEFDTPGPWVPKKWALTQLRQLHSLVVRVGTTRDGIRLAKAFIAFFTAYILCLVPVMRDWLGRYYYMMAISVILNHPARTVGAQIEGAVLVISGIATGLGWGAIGLLVSTSTVTASAGYGGILAIFLALFMLSMAWIRSFFIRFYQFVLCAGISIVFTTLAETNSQDISWFKLRTFAVPWLLGQCIALVINCALFPDAGSRALACTLHGAFNTLGVSVLAPLSYVRLTGRQDALKFDAASRNSLREFLAKSFVDLSEAHRDMRIEITVSRYRPHQVESLRNNMQAVIRAFLSLFASNASFSSYAAMVEDDYANTDHEIRIVLEGAAGDAHNGGEHDNNRRLVGSLRDPTMSLISRIGESLKCCHAALMELSGYREEHLGPYSDIDSDVGASQLSIKHTKATFDIVIAKLLESHYSDSTMSEDSQVVEAFVFARLVREAIEPVEALMTQIDSMQKESNWPKVYMPSYPLPKAIHQTNAQVRHDRGGAIAGSSQVTFAHISQAFSKIKLREHKPTPEVPGTTETDVNVNTSKKDTGTRMKKRKKLRYKIWRLLYRLQGFESRYAFKVCLVTSLLSIPSYLEQGHAWWDRYEAWWAVVMAWAMMHPRVGGSIQDLFTRASITIFGAVWSGIAYAAGQGNPYVMAVFAAMYMLPMLYRYAISSHPVRTTVPTFDSILTHSAIRASGLPVVYSGISRSTI